MLALSRTLLPATTGDDPPPARRAGRGPARRRDVLRPLRLRGVRRAARRPARLAGGADRRARSGCSCAGSAGSPWPTATRWSTCACSAAVVRLRDHAWPSPSSRRWRAAAGAGPLLPATGSATPRSSPALGVTAYAVGSAISAPLAGRVVTRIGRPLVVAGAVTFGLGAVALAVVARARARGPRDARARRSAVRDGLRPGGGDHAQPDLALMDVDPQMGSTAGGVLQTGQRIGLAIGQALIGAVFFNSLTGHESSTTYSRALGLRRDRGDLLRLASRSRSGCTTWCSARRRESLGLTRDGRRPAPRGDTGLGWTTGSGGRAHRLSSPWPRRLWRDASARSRCPTSSSMRAAATKDGDGGDAGDRAHGGERVAVEQQTTERLTLEQGLRVCPASVVQASVAAAFGSRALRDVLHH